MSSHARLYNIKSGLQGEKTIILAEGWFKPAGLIITLGMPAYKGLLEGLLFCRLRQVRCGPEIASRKAKSGDYIPIQVKFTYNSNTFCRHRKRNGPSPTVSVRRRTVNCFLLNVDFVDLP